MNKLKLIASISLLAISVNSAFAQTKSSLPSSWQTTVTAKPKVKEEKPIVTNAPVINTPIITSPQQLPKGAIVLPMAFLSSCENKKQGNSCEFNMDNKKVTGVCSSIGNNKTLGCKVSNPQGLIPSSAKSNDIKEVNTKSSQDKMTSNLKAMPTKLAFAPKEETIAACSNKSIGNGCEVSSPTLKFKGLCIQAPSAKNLVCNPQSIPDKLVKNIFVPPPPFPPFKACEGKSIGNFCSMDINGKKTDGVCSKLPESKKIGCMPNNFSKVK